MPFPSWNLNLEVPLDAKPLARALALLLAILSGFMGACMIVGLLLGEGFPVIYSFFIPLIIGLIMLILLRLTGSGVGRTQFSPRSGYLFVTLGWIFAMALGALPFMMSGVLPSYVDACFETISGLTTTGSTVLMDIEVVPRSILLWRATTHWLGGMGIVVLTVAIFPLLGFSSRSLMEAEAPGPQMDKITPRLSETAKILWLIYLGLTIFLVILLLLGGMNLFDAVTHSFATMATGGFSTRNLSVGAYQSVYIDVVITVFMFLAGMNFTLHWKLLRGEFKVFSRNSEFKTYLYIFLGASILIAWDLWTHGNYTSPAEALRFASFQASSIMTTTGFATADYLNWPAFSQTVLFTLMFVGGCAGSTAGGIKVGRIFTLFKMGLSEMKYLLNPRAVYGVFVDGNYLKKNIVYDIAALVFLYFFSIIASTLVVSSGGFDLVTSLTATLASLGNIGPGFGRVGPAFTFAFFPDYIKVWLSFVMLLGRLEIYTVLVLFTRSFWRRA